MLLEAVEVLILLTHFEFLFYIHGIYRKTILTQLNTLCKKYVKITYHEYNSINPFTWWAYKGSQDIKHQRSSRIYVAKRRYSA